MTIQVQGTLVDPLNQPSVNTVIRVTALTSVGTLMTLPASTQTDGAGAYNFQIVDGTHEIEVLFSDEYKLTGTVLVDGTTPTPITLIDLLNR